MRKILLPPVVIENAYTEEAKKADKELQMIIKYNFPLHVTIFLK